MAILFENYKDGALYAFPSPTTLPALIQGVDIFGCIITALSMSGKIRYSLEYALSGNPYLYLFGTELTKLQLGGYATQLLCRDGTAYSNGLTNLLRTYALWANPVYGTPIIVLHIDGGVQYRGILLAFDLRSSEAPNMIAFSLEMVGFYYA